jgi:hypothetical protein
MTEEEPLIPEPKEDGHFIMMDYGAPQFPKFDMDWFSLGDIVPGKPRVDNRTKWKKMKDRFWNWLHQKIEDKGYCYCDSYDW